jgi:hypothetical protein
LAHVAAGPADAIALSRAELALEEGIDGLAPLAAADPDDAGTIKVVDEGGVFVPLRIGDLVDADGLEPSDSMARPDPGDRAVQQVGERGAGDPE